MPAGFYRYVFDIGPAVFTPNADDSMVHRLLVNLIVFNDIGDAEQRIFVIVRRRIFRRGTEFRAERFLVGDHLGIDPDLTGYFPFGQPCRIEHVEMTSLRVVEITLINSIGQGGAGVQRIMQYVGLAFVSVEEFYGRRVETVRLGKCVFSVFQIAAQEAVRRYVGVIPSRRTGILNTEARRTLQLSVLNGFILSNVQPSITRPLVELR